MDDILDRVAGSMALEGFELTEDDRRRIQTLTEHPELKEKLLQELVKKHTDKQGDMAMEELYIQFDQERDTIMCWWPDESGMSLNASDEFYVWLEKEWQWTKLCWDEETGWYLNAVPEIDLQSGQKIKIAIMNIFQE